MIMNINKKPSYPIGQICQDVADGLRNSRDCSPTTIRCAINDVADAKDKDGFRVSFNFNQTKAIRRVARLLAH